MNLSRIEDYLFNDHFKSAQRDRLVIVLTACCKAAKARQQERDFPLPLTAEVNGFSVDEIMEHIPFSSTAPVLAFQKMYRIVEVIKTIAELEYLGYISDSNCDFEVITLTDVLFRAIAEEWAYARGSRPHRISDVKIFAPSMELAMVIADRRIARQQNRHIRQQKLEEIAA